ncbi:MULTISPECIES: C1 family peptidase [unclassified Nostoc]|uniref:C1 family peptidase n=1 Tax=unclassified Nostoc TaxID=2593658 RepID=UPI0025E3C306|nr:MULTISPECIES: C1 family peptidase [unclassified Nostoc]
MAKKSTGWIPDYPDFRDYRMDEINQKLTIAVQDIQINNDNDNDLQSSIEELFELLKLIKKNDPDPKLNKTVDSKFLNFEKKINKGFKLVNAKAFKEETFLVYGCVGQEVYNLQQKLLIFTKHTEDTEYKKKFEKWTEEITDFREGFEKSDYIEYGYFGKNTEKGVKLFKKIFGLSIVSNDSVVDKVTLSTLNQVLEILKRKRTDKDKEVKKTIKELEMLDEKIKEIQIELNKLGCLTNLEQNNEAVNKLFAHLIEDAIQEFQKCSESYGSNINDIVNEHTSAKSNKIVDSYNALFAINKQQRWLVVPPSSAIPVNLYEIILRVFEISDIPATHWISENGFISATYNNTFCINKDQSELKRAIDMIVELVAQLISPLAQHRNLEKAVIDVLEKLDQWFDKSEYVNCIRPEKNQLQKSRNQKHSPQDLVEKLSSVTQVEQGRNLFKDRDLNLVSLYISLSTVSNFKLSLNKLNQTIDDNDRKKRIATSLKKIDNIFKSLKDLEYLEVFLKRYNPPVQEENNLKNQPTNLRTVIQILPELEAEPSELNKNPESQSDLQVPLEGDLQKQIIEIQEKGKEVTVYLLMPEFVDLSFWCSPVEDQGSLDSCTAHAGVALMEYFEKRSFDRYVDASRLFLYKATRNLMHRQGDAGASLRQTMKAMALFGVPPEEYWPYTEDKFDEEPTPFCYSFGQNYQALKYFRLNPLGTTEDILLFRIKTALASGFPCAFGFTMYYSIEDLNPSGHIPYPVKNDKVKGGHAVVAVGYDDHKVIENADGSKRSQGALLIRNSWGTDWGEGGYGWLPYDYVLEGLTNDWWSLVKSKWFETGHFGLGANDWVSNLGGVDGDNILPENH